MVGTENERWMLRLSSWLQEEQKVARWGRTIAKMVKVNSEVGDGY